MFEAHDLQNSYKKKKGVKYIEVKTNSQTAELDQQKQEDLQ